MAIFDSLISEVAQKFGLGDKAGGLLAGVLSLITNADSGGLAGFIGKFTGAGLGNVVNSWVSRGENTALTNDQLSSVLGNQTICTLADKVGISPVLTMPALAYMLPKVVDALTPEGVMPSSLPNTITNYISNFGGMLGKGVGTVTGAAGAGAVGAGAGLASAAGAMGSGARATAGAVGSGAKASGIVPDEATKASILNPMKATYGEGKYVDDKLVVDARARPAQFSTNLNKALGEFKLPGTNGSQLSFDGSAINISGLVGAAADSLKTELLRQRLQY